MSRALAIATAILTISHSYVSAQAPPCLPNPEYQWTYNSQKQSPCTVTVALGGVCVNDGFTLDPLPSGYVYLGPTQETANSCRCSSVYYSLLSACAYCQNETFLDWSIYDVNCSTVYIDVFKDPIPSSILVPHYAYLDVVTDNTFNINAAMTAGGADSSAVPQATSSTSTTSTATATHSVVLSKIVNIGAIVGGVVGGLAIIAIIGLIAFIIIRLRKRSSPSMYAPYASASPQMGSAHSPVSAKFYDPNNPSTYPSYANPLSYGSALPNDASHFASDPATYSTYSGSPPHRVAPAITGSTLVGVAQVPSHKQYTGAPEV